MAGPRRYSRRNAQKKSYEVIHLDFFKAVDDIAAREVRRAHPGMGTNTAEISAATQPASASSVGNNVTSPSGSTASSTGTSTPNTSNGSAGNSTPSSSNTSPASSLHHQDSGLGRRGLLSQQLQGNYQQQAAAIRYAPPPYPPPGYTGPVTQRQYAPPPYPPPGYTGPVVQHQHVIYAPQPTYPLAPLVVTNVHQAAGSVQAADHAPSAVILPSSAVDFRPEDESSSLRYSTQTDDLVGDDASTLEREIQECDIELYQIFKTQTPHHQAMAAAEFPGLLESLSSASSSSRILQDLQPSSSSSFVHQQRPGKENQDPNSLNQGKKRSREDKQDADDNEEGSTKRQKPEEHAMSEKAKGKQKADESAFEEPPVNINDLFDFLAYEAEQRK